MEWVVCVWRGKVLGWLIAAACGRMEERGAGNSVLTPVSLDRKAFIVLIVLPTPDPLLLPPLPLPPLILK